MLHVVKLEYTVNGVVHMPYRQLELLPFRICYDEQANVFSEMMACLAGLDSHKLLYAFTTVYGQYSSWPFLFGSDGYD